jgi:ornithine cyclodeaminase/alanine dehydrogenase-like protein (mu-crystallin family)
VIGLSIEMLDASRIRAVLPMSACIDAMDVAMRGTSDGSIDVPLRTVVPLGDGADGFLAMPGAAIGAGVYGAKLVSLHRGNPAQGRPAVQGCVVLFDSATGTPVALLDGAEITALRTAAASGLATRELARPDAATLGILGCGVQGAVHLDAIGCVRKIREVRVWGRNPASAREFAERHAAGLRGATIFAVDSAAEAAACDIVCVVTGAHEPVIRGEWLRPGAHVNLVGAHTPTSREADSGLIAHARVYVDSRISARSEAGDLLIPEREGAIAPDHVVGEIGDVLLGRVAGRRDDREITVYKSLGLVAQDLIAAQWAMRRHRNLAG